MSALLVVFAIAVFAPSRSTDPKALWLRPPVYPGLKLNVRSFEEPHQSYLDLQPIHVPGRDPGEVTTEILYSETNDSPERVLTFYTDAYRAAGWEARSTTPDAGAVRFIKSVTATTQQPNTKVYTFEVAAHDYSPYGTSVHMKLGVIQDYPAQK